MSGEDHEFTEELGVRKTPLSTIIIGVAGAMVGVSSGIFSLEEALLVIIAISTTTNALIDYFGGKH